MKRIFLFFIFLLFFISIFSQTFKNIKIYLWDNDFGAQFINPDVDQLLIGYEYNLLKSFKTLGYVENVNLFLRDTIPSTFSNLRNYQALFIVTGHYPLITRNPMFTLEEIGLLSMYLDSGGCVYFEGNNVLEFLQQNFRSFVYDYFNDTTDFSISLRGIDTLRVDQTSGFTRNFSFAYPAFTVSDSGTDLLIKKDPTIGRPYYYQVLYYDDQSKLYRSSATAYTPPESKSIKKYYKGRIYLQNIDFGALSDGVSRLDRPLPDSIRNNLVRSAYLRDILKFFGFAKTLLVLDDGSDTIATSVERALSRMVDFDTIMVPLNYPGPGYKTLSKYNSIIWYTDTVDFPFVSGIRGNDSTNIGTYLDYGGNLLLSSVNLAEEYVNDNIFLTKYLGVNLVGDSFSSNTIYGNPVFVWGNNPVLDTFLIVVPSGNGYEPDHVSSYDTLTDTIFYFYEGSRTKKVCGTYRDNKTYRTIFLTFPFQRAQTQIKAGYPTDSIIRISLVDIFKYDFSIQPLGIGITTYNFNISFDVKEDKILINIFTRNNFEGRLVVLHEDRELKNLSIKGNRFEVSLEKKAGDYRVLIIDNFKNILEDKTFTVDFNNDIFLKASLNGILRLVSENNKIIEIYDIAGNRIKTILLKKGENLLDISKINSGIYFLRYDKKYYRILKL